MTASAVVLLRPSDMHVHVREGQMLKDVADASIGSCHWVLIMPNLDPHPITHGLAAVGYMEDVRRALPRRRKPNLWPTLYLTPETDERMIRDAYKRLAGRVSVKYYPFNTTTHSGHGLRDIHDGWPIFAVMEELGMILNIHGEVSTLDLAHAEQQFLKLFLEVHVAFPDLRMVFEHVSSREAIEMIKGLPFNIAGSITAHHPCLTVDDVEMDGEVVHPHHACLPRAKTEGDRLSIVDTILDLELDGPPKFFFGSDPAPHNPVKKVPGKGCANGVYSGPVALPVLAEIFEASGLVDWADRLEHFVSLAGPQFYGVDPPEEEDTIVLLKEPWIVPDEINGIVPFRAGQTLQWRLHDPLRPYEQ